MINENIAGGTVHNLPQDIGRVLRADTAARAAWQSLTPLARNEWICWITNAKQATTRKRHIERTVNELAKGKRRPCCWMGCIHRLDKPISPSVQWVLDRQSRPK